MLDLRTDYSAEAFADPDTLVQRANDALRGVDYDTMIATGTSGSTVVPYLARVLGKHFAIVRKASENAHTDELINGMIGDRWIFVDDFVGVGGTIKRVFSAMRDVSRDYDTWPLFVGSYLYSKERLVTPGYETGETDEYGHPGWVDAVTEKGKFAPPGHETCFEECFGLDTSCRYQGNAWHERLRKGCPEMLRVDRRNLAVGA